MIVTTDSEVHQLRWAAADALWHLDRGDPLAARAVLLAVSSGASPASGGEWRGDDRGSVSSA